MKHKFDYRVYYEDTDAGGIMYHGNFINFCERGRSELLREVGLPASQVTKELGVGFVVRHLDADYMGMVRLDDLLTVETSVTSMKNTSFLMEQRLICQNKVVFVLNVTIVCIDMQGKPVRIPDALRQKFDEYKEEDA
jgi:acyl-CoA thioester hydrolase